MSANHKYAMREADYSSTETSSPDGSDAGRAASDRPLIPACSPVLLPSPALLEDIDNYTLEPPPIPPRNPARLLPRNPTKNPQAGIPGHPPLKPQTTTNTIGLTSQPTSPHFSQIVTPQPTQPTTAQTISSPIPRPPNGPLTSHHIHASDLISFPTTTTTTTSTAAPSTKPEIRTCHTCSKNDQWSYIRLSSGWKCVQGHENPRYCKKCEFDSQVVDGDASVECKEFGWCEEDQVFGKRRVSKKTLEKHRELEEGMWREHRNWKADVARWVRGLEREREDVRRRESVEAWVVGVARGVY